MPTESEDTILLEKLSEGDSHAFDVIFNKYWEISFNEAYKRLQDKEEAKDIVQDLFTHLWIKRESIQIQNLPAYLYVAVRNRVLKSIALKNKTHAFYELNEQVPAEDQLPDAKLLWKEFLKKYEALIANLPPKRQEIFRLRYQNDQTTNAIAEKMRITRKTVQNQLGKAIETLRGALTEIFLFILILTLFSLN